MIHYPRDMTAGEIASILVREWAPVMLEIGCASGEDSVRFKSAIPGVQLFCFEPDPRNIALFKARPELDCVPLVEAACASYDGECDWFPSTGDLNSPHCWNHDWSLSSSIHRPTGHLSRSREIGFKPPTKVPCICLDTWLDAQNLLDIAFIWADVQGAQRDVIGGGRGTFNAARYVYMECHDTPLYDGEPTAAELHAMLPNHQPVAKYAENFLYVRLT